jgi:hypothetical protein
VTLPTGCELSATVNVLVRPSGASVVVSEVALT